jgi:phytoene/squalene synthetase
MLRKLDEWGDGYEEGLAAASIRDALRAGVPCFLASFTRVVRERGIPPEHYRAFLAAMRHDAAPRPFETLAHLIQNYIYGSAIVVGYFLTYVYGASAKENFPRALCERAEPQRPLARAGRRGRDALHHGERSGE